jgi:hypothetical protein
MDAYAKRPEGIAISRGLHMMAMQRGLRGWPRNKAMGDGHKTPPNKHIAVGNLMDIKA